MRNSILGFFLLITLVAAGQSNINPDTSFNGNGRKVFTVGQSLDFGDNIALQSDGKIIMTGASMSLGGPVSLAVCRLNPNGSFDNTFGTAGISLIDLGGLPSQGGFEPEIVIQPDGKLVINGFAWNGTDEDMFICRLLPNGSLDPAFGTGGTVYIGLMSPGMPDGADAITMDASGNIYACGSTRTGGTPMTNDLAVVKLTPAGVLDPTFSGDGKLLLDVSASADYGHGIAAIAGGKIVITGQCGYPADFFAIRLLPDGSYDPSFGTNGKTQIDIFGNNIADDCWGMTMTPDGKILMAGDAYNLASSSFSGVVVRLTANGVPDVTFSGDGIATVSASAQSTIFRNILVQPDGKYLVSGSTGTDGADDFTVAVLNNNGTLDPAFNGTGIYTMDVTGQNNLDKGFGLALQSDGKILLSGNTSISEYINEKYSIVRLNTKEVIAAFTSSATLACAGQQVQFTNGSTGANLSYLWTFQGGSPATSTLQNPTVTYSAPGLYDVQLIAYNGSFSDTINKNDYIQVVLTPATPATPVGNTVLCEGETATYSTTPVTYASSYLWVVTPASAGSLSGNGITATFTASWSYTGPYTVKVNANGQCGSSTFSGELNCTMNHTPLVYMLTGNGEYCAGTGGASLTLAGSETGVSYQLYRDNQPSGTVIPGTGAALVWNNITTEGFYTVSTVNAPCTKPMAGQVYVMMINIPSAPASPAGNNIVCNTSVETYTIPAVPTANTYSWVLTPTGAGTLTENGIQATVTWSSAYIGSATLTVSATNSCGTSALSTALSINVNDTPEPSVSGPALVCVNMNAQYETSSVSGSNYTWSATGGNIVSGAGAYMITVNWNTPGTGTLMVSETSSQNCTGTSTVFNVVVDPCTSSEELPAADPFAVYPNPATGKISVKLNDATKHNSHLRFFDVTGRLVLEVGIAEGVKRVEFVDISNLKAGIYILQYIKKGSVVSQEKVVKL
jgi:uncharacterized delta-60 repeat protein